MNTTVDHDRQEGEHAPEFQCHVTDGGVPGVVLHLKNPEELSAGVARDLRNALRSAGINGHESSVMDVLKRMGFIQAPEGAPKELETRAQLVREALAQQGFPIELHELAVTKLVEHSFAPGYYRLTGDDGSLVATVAYSEQTQASDGAWRATA